MTPQQYCEEKVARSGSSLYYSLLFLPPEQRQATIALYAFCREVGDVVDHCREPAVANHKLQWWRDELQRTFQDNPYHPVARALQPTIRRHDLAIEQFEEVIDGIQMDLDYDSYPSFSELSLYCYRAAGVVGVMTAEIFGYEDRDTIRYARDLGLALKLTHIIRDVGEDVRRGRVYLPLDELQRFGVSPGDLTLAETPERVRELLAFQARRAHDYYDRALAHLPDADRYRQRGGLIMASIYRTLLTEIERDQLRVLEHRTSLTPLRKLWIAWRTARRERRRRPTAA